MTLEATSLLSLKPQFYLNADQRAGYGDNGKDSFTIDEAASQLLRGQPGWSWALGQPFTVSYAFRADAFQMPADTTGFVRFNPAQIAATELALKAWSDVADIRFVRVGSGTAGELAYANNASILFGGYQQGWEDAAAFSYYPGSTSVASAAGDVWVNTSLSYNRAPTLGTFGANVLVHEIGHAIGLAHPSEYDAGNGATFSYGANASYYEDNLQYTVMSYFSETSTGAYYAGAYSSAPMLDDIAAAQLAYGANYSTRTGDTIYGFNATADAPWFSASSASSKLVFAVWDAGGTDTFNFSGYGLNQLIDLREGYFSNVGGLTGNVAVAQNVSIENALGGAGGDVIRGNAFANSIDGGAGADTIDGGAGGRNTLFGGDGSDLIQGGADFDQVNGNKGADTIDGGSGGDDWLLGGQGDDLITAHDGRVILNGNIGLDTVNGAAGDDIVRGGQGADVLSAGAGADHLFGDLGNDTLTGGGGADVFHFALGGGLDRIVDFQLAESDRIQLDGVASWTAAQSGADAVLSYGAGEQVLLVGVQATDVAGAILLA